MEPTLVEVGFFKKGINICVMQRNESKVAELTYGLVAGKDIWCREDREQK